MNLQELIVSYKQRKNINRLTEILNMLRPIIRKKAWTLHGYLPSYDIKDLEQELIILIMHMIAKYNSKRSKFITYLIIRFKGDPLKILQKQIAQKRGGTGYWNLKNKRIYTQSLNEIIMTGQKTLLDTLKDSSNIRDIIDDVMIRREVIGLLSTTVEKKIFDLQYTYQLPQRIIAKKMKMKQKEVSKIIKEIRKNPRIIKVCNEIRHK